VVFLASIGMRMLMTVARTLCASGGRLVLLNPREQVREALELPGLSGQAE
jgi:anti-anti-sigma regulatory factor